MVDFVKALGRLKAWKIAKAEIGCDCEAEHTVTCYQWRRDSEEVKECSCKCHKV